MRRAILLLAALALTASAACRQSAADPAAALAERVLAECREDAACARERWRHEDLRSLGLSAEVAWSDPTARAVVATTREIVTPPLRGTACAPSRGALVYWTVVSIQGTPGPGLAAFAWPSLDAATAGQRLARAAVASASGDPQALRAAIETSPELEAACVRFAGWRDRCDATG